MLRHHVGVTTVERPDPKGLSTFNQCTEFLPHRGFELMSSTDLELGALTKWLPSNIKGKVAKWWPFIILLLVTYFMMAALLTGELPFSPLSTQYISPTVDTYTVSILQQKPISTAGRTWIYFTPSVIFSKDIVCLKIKICTEEQQKL